MPQSFALLEATLITSQFSDRSNSLSIHLKHSQQSRARFTVITGENGTGKSRLLSAIALAFLSLELRQQRALPRPRPKYRTPDLVFPLELLSYQIDGRTIEIKQANATLFAYVDGNRVDLEEVPLPKRVIAVTMSAFDRFPLSSKTLDDERSLYRYLGLRDRTGRASNTRLLSEIISSVSLRDSQGEEIARRVRVGSTLRYAGFHPKMAVSFKVRVSLALFSYLHQHFDPGHLSARDRSEAERIERSVHSGAVNRSQLTIDIEAVQARLVRSTFSENIDFDNLGQHNPDLAAANRLRELGLLTISEIKVSHLDGDLFDLKHASSGEQSMIATFVGLAAHISDASLVLIDGPETSLHPQWQTEFIKRLLDTFGRVPGIDYIVATHSPLIVSDLPPDTLMISLDHEKHANRDLSSLSGASSDVILAELFDSPGHRNLHVRDLLLEAFDLMANHKQTSPEFKNICESLRQLQDNLPTSDPTRPVIKELLISAGNQ